MTRVIKLDPINFSDRDLDEASEVLREGRLVSFPTETVYGLGAIASECKAVEKIYLAKGRPKDNPLIVHISKIEEAYEYALVNEEIESILTKIWPGPITLVLPSKGKLCKDVQGGLDSIAIRLPAHPIAIKLIEKTGTPIAAPSANKSGKPSPTKASHVLEDLDGKVDLIIDAGETFFGVESTVVKPEAGEVVILRPGPFTPEEIEKVFNMKVRIPPFSRGFGEAEVSLAPGTRYRHYAPKKPLLVLEDKKLLNELIIKLNSINLKPEILNFGEDLYSIAKNLFDVLRGLDKSVGDVGIALGVEEKGIGLAIMNRLRKASGGLIIRDENDMDEVVERLRRLFIS
jgi:L-threonylcarbamoyladenylate synthase